MQMEIPLFIHCSHTMGQVTSPLFNVDDSNPSSCKASINRQRRETSLKYRNQPMAEEGVGHCRAHFAAANIVRSTKKKHCLIIQEEWDAVLTALHIHLVTAETLRGVGDTA